MQMVIARGFYYQKFTAKVQDFNDQFKRLAGVSFIIDLHLNYM